MRYVLLSLTLVVLLGIQAMAGDGNVSKVTLEKMGLTTMQVVTDTKGMSVRGTGFAKAWSFSYALGGLPSFQTSPPLSMPVSTSSFGWGSFATGWASAYAK
jgi:hypothetical protein